jgi:hypothetical protein
MDIDIDFPTTFDPLELFEAVRASMVKNNKLAKHPVGVYFQNIPTDSITGLAAIPYDRAEELGYFKIDFLHLTLLDYFESKEQIRKLMKIPPDWSLLEDEQVVSKLFQIHKHHKTIQKVKPKSVQELADVIALIRPGKRYLLPVYLENKEATREELYAKPDDGSIYFKKPHAVAYALTIVLQLHLIKGGIL